jgi:hypothetical protein
LARYRKANDIRPIEVNGEPGFAVVREDKYLRVYFKHGKALIEFDPTECGLDPEETLELARSIRND